MEEDYSDTIPEDTYTPRGKKTYSTESGTGMITSIKKNPKGFYTLKIGADYYTAFINTDKDEAIYSDLKAGDEIKVTWITKYVGDKEFKNIRQIQKLSSGHQTKLSTSDTNDIDEKITEFRKRKIEGITFGMALNNAAILLASIANTQDDPEKWIKENIGGPLWKAIEQKLFENYKEQRMQLTGE